jgi:hypothetical protein
MLLNKNGRSQRPNLHHKTFPQRVSHGEIQHPLEDFTLDGERQLPEKKIISQVAHK